MPANDGLRPDNRQGIANIRKQSIKADEYHPVECAEAEPLRRGAPENDDLLTEGQVLSFKVRPRSEQPDQQPPSQFAGVPHRATASPDSHSLANRMTFAI